MAHTWDEIAAAVSLLREVVLNDNDNVGMDESEIEGFVYMTDTMMNELADRMQNRARADRHAWDDDICGRSLAGAPQTGGGHPSLGLAAAKGIRCLVSGHACGKCSTWNILEIRASRWRPCQRGWSAA